MICENCSGDIIRGYKCRSGNEVCSECADECYKQCAYCELFEHESRIGRKSISKKYWGYRSRQYLCGDCYPKVEGEAV